MSFTGRWRCFQLDAVAAITSNKFADLKTQFLIVTTEERRLANSKLAAEFNYLYAGNSRAGNDFVSQNRMAACAETAVE